VKGRYAYVSGASLAPGFLYVLDIIDPINANIVGSITSGLAADQFRSTISDGYLYTIGRNSNSFSVINVTDPTNPVLLSSISAGNYPETFYVVGHYAYILNTHGNDMSIMDITNPSAPTEILPRVTIGGYRTWCVGSGRYLYVGDIYSTVSVYDLQGAEIGSLYAGILKSDNIQTTRTISVGTDLFVNNALIVGLGGIGTDGALSVLGTTTSSFFGGRLGIGTSTPSAQLTVAGSVRLASLGSGTVTSDANGNLTVSSDERLKDVQNNFTRGLADLQKVNPINYNWKPETGFDASSTYTGFSAQNVQLAIPEAVATNSIGYLTLSDRPILATVVNALKEIGSFIAKIENGIAYLKNIVVERLTIGSADKPTGITMYDEDTKAPYCLKIKSGVTITTPGECGNSSPAPVVTPVVTTPIVETSTTAETTTTPVVVATSTDPVVTTSTDPAPVAPVVVEPVVEPDPVVVIDPAPVVPETTPEAPAESAPADPVASPQE
ncbi:MAG: tail fiber domain-containing protein, partial [bacterium]